MRGQGATFPAERRRADSPPLGASDATCYAVFHLSWEGTIEERRRIVGIFADRESAEQACSAQSAAAEQFVDWPLSFSESFSVATLPVGLIFNPEAVALDTRVSDEDTLSL